MASTSHPPSQPAQTILVVEDEAVINDLLCDILEGEGFDVVAKANADEALEHLVQASSGVSLILTDINMPGAINGAELANHAIKTWPAIPIIVMSGLENPQSMSISADVLFMRKPFGMTEMVRKVQRALTNQR